MQQIYKRTLTPKCDFDKFAKKLYWKRTSAWVFCKFAAYYQNTFSQEHLWRLRLQMIVILGENLPSMHKNTLPNWFFRYKFSYTIEKKHQRKIKYLSTIRK